ncbi:protein DOUBLE-STRAND BREAK FORMATION [Arachis duranensis]|uniref:Protein DOUBLE-STRAND BREAK FORMATION n=1 Tax=Arachis duranensis TaxID=130453 RepID=A0A9C6TNH8_ARADU|nr:protein DOUBLE-STRAND BREAK FORMATION [Arachis duranensis]
MAEHALNRGSDIKLPCFSDSTLLFLGSLLVSKDVKSLIEVRSDVTQLLRSESISVLLSISDKTVHEKLLVLEFFVRAFALVGDHESCLALRYEALVMRETKSSKYQWLRVTPLEWLRFVEDALNNGFHSVAEKACENALSYHGNNDVLKPGPDAFTENLNAISEITRLRNRAMTLVASRSVQVQAEEYLRRKTSEQKMSGLSYKEERCPASTAFRNGIKRQNLRRLYQHQSLLKINDELDGSHLNLRLVIANKTC